jgi:hypothetical protein
MKFISRLISDETPSFAEREQFARYITSGSSRAGAEAMRSWQTQRKGTRFVSMPKHAWNP